MSKLLEEAISKKKTEENGELTDSENYVNKEVVVVVLVVVEQATVETDLHLQVHIKFNLYLITYELSINNT